MYGLGSPHSGHGFRSSVTTAPTAAGISMHGQTWPHLPQRAHTESAIGIFLGRLGLFMQPFATVNHAADAAGIWAHPNQGAILKMRGIDEL